MASLTPVVSPALLEELYLLKRETAFGKMGRLFDGERRELCIQTRHPKQLPLFINACLARRGELETGAGARSFLIRDRATWEEMCSLEQPIGRILIADQELDFAAVQGELLSQARKREHSVIYTLANPRPDTMDVVVLNEPKEYDIREVLERHDFTRPQAEKLAAQSSGNVYLLTRLLTGTASRPAWLTDESVYPLRGLALLGAWDDASESDQQAVARITGETHDRWAERIYPLVRQNDPPLLLEGNMFRPVSRYENWQIFSTHLTDADLRRFAEVAKEVLGQDESQEELEQETFVVRKEENRPVRYSGQLRKDIAETLALLAAQGRLLDCTPNLAQNIVDGVVRSLLDGKDWIRWASLSRLFPRLAEASPTSFLSALETALVDLEKSPIRRIFVEQENALFGRSYHPNLLWALETLAWSPDYLNRVCLILTQFTKFKLPGNSGNNPLGTLTSIFLPWLPQTLASIDARITAVECVISEDSETGWKLLLSLLPQSQQSSSYNPKPAWRDWFPEDWREGVTHGDHGDQSNRYSELAVSLAVEDSSKLGQLISRWGNLPRESSNKLLEFVRSESAFLLSEEQRYSIWEKLSSQVRRHRKYASSKWALPEDDVRLLEEAATVIKPQDPLFTSRWLFNSYDHDLFESDDYEEETAKVAVRREEAVRDVLLRHGFSGLERMAIEVTQPGQLGSAVARTEDPQFDGKFLPRLLEEQNEKLKDFIRGYVWSRYWAESVDWIARLGVGKWDLEPRVKFFSYLPFHAQVWRLAEKELGERVVDYWNAIRPNVFQAKDALLEAAGKALEFSRPEIAVDCAHAMLFNKEEVAVDFATTVIEACLLSDERVPNFNQYHLLEVLAFIQKAPDAPQDRVAVIEFHCMALLDSLSSGRPLSLERKLARDPTFFHEIIGYCYRSQHGETGLDEALPDVNDEKTLTHVGEIYPSSSDLQKDDQRRALATQAYRLLDRWSMPPGINEEESMIDEESFAAWFNKAKEMCEASGHWLVAQLQIGNCLMNVPGFHGDDGGKPAGMPRLEMLLKHPLVAKMVDSAGHEHVRQGMTTELFNSRGIHGFSHGQQEVEIAKEYRAYATRYDEQKLPRIATSLRGLAEGYERDAEREKKRAH